MLIFTVRYTAEPPNNEHIGDEHFVHYSEVVPSSEVDIYGEQCVHCREVVHSSECPLSEVALYTLMSEDPPKGGRCPQHHLFTMLMQHRRVV